MNYLYIGLIVVVVIGLYQLVQCMKTKDDYFSYYPLVERMNKDVNEGNYIELDEQQFRELEKNNKIALKREEADDCDEEEEEGEDVKEGFGWVKYGRHRRQRMWYPYFRYAGYPYWRFIRYPYYGYGSPYQTVKYDGDYWMVTV